MYCDMISLMEKNLEEPLGRVELARSAGLSTRQLERLFRKYLNRSPARYYLELRLNKARLLLHTDRMSGQPQKIRLRAELILIEIDKALKGLA